MEYLKRVLGIKAIYGDNDTYEEYQLRNVSLDGKDAIFVYPDGETEDMKLVKESIAAIERIAKVPAVLVTERLTYRQKEYLLREHVPFIVDGKQIYLPFMALYLQERADSEKMDIEEMLPATQLLLLYYIYQGCGQMLASKAADALGLTAMSISRASRQLESLELVQTEKVGVQKMIFSDKSPRELFDEARKYLQNPVKRTIRVSKSEILPQGKTDIAENLATSLIASGLEALSKHVTSGEKLAMQAAGCYATGNILAWEKRATKKLLETEDECMVELWRYDPRKLADGQNVDRLSLALTLAEDRNEDVQQAVSEMLEELWAQIGNGNTLELATVRQQASSREKTSRKRQSSKQEQDAKPKTKRQPQPEQKKKKDTEKPETDIRNLMDGMSPEDIDMRQIGTHHRSKQDMLDELRSIYL